MTDANLPGPGMSLGWLERRRAVKAERQSAAARQRVIDRINRLGPDWRVLDARSFGLPGSLDFLLFGPGGIFTVQVKAQGRTRVMVAGDVVQIDGKRPPFIASARRDAKLASTALTKATGRQIPVIPIVVFVGSGQLSMQGLPKGCLIAHYREIDRILLSRGSFLSSRSVDTLYEVAARPSTWAPPADAPTLKAA
ncbi:nuclease-related domain-containing protein [Longispora albida]|uniref:nuclease-related domain-containing protein n=1 Tax=Longispora albida TaxID=203523 RepID=UPI0012F7DE2C|nr:nuclease-related domain-containing protein [Longispora albida]